MNQTKRIGDMKSIKEKAEEAQMGYDDIQAPAIGRGFVLGANAVLEKIESLIKNTSGEGEVYHYNLYMGLQKLVKELKGE